MINYMKEIAKAMKVDWEPKDMSYLDPPIATGYSIAPVHVYNTVGPQSVPMTTPGSYQPATSVVPPIFQPPLPPMFHPPTNVSPGSPSGFPPSYPPPPPPSAGGGGGGAAVGKPPSVNLGFDLPSVPTTVTPAPSNASAAPHSRSDAPASSLDIPDFDELQKRFAELKR